VRIELRILGERNRGGCVPGGGVHGTIGRAVPVDGMPGGAPLLQAGRWRDAELLGALRRAATSSGRLRLLPLQSRAASFEMSGRFARFSADGGAQGPRAYTFTRARPEIDALVSAVSDIDLRLKSAKRFEQSLRRPFI